jgi:hypothetical protein
LAGDGSNLPHSKFKELFLSKVQHDEKPNMSNSWFVRTQTKEPPTPHPPRRTHSHSLPHSHSVLARDGSKLPHSKFRELFLSLVRHAAKPNMSNSYCGLILFLLLILILYWPGMAANLPTASSENSFYL